MNNQTNNQPKRTITRRNRTKQSTTNKMAVVHFTHSSNRSQRLAPKLLSHHSHLLSHKLTCGAFGWPPAVESSASRGTECRPHPYVVTHTPADAAGPAIALTVVTVVTALASIASASRSPGFLPPHSPLSQREHCPPLMSKSKTVRCAVPPPAESSAIYRLVSLPRPPLPSNSSPLHAPHCFVQRRIVRQCHRFDSPSFQRQPRPPRQQ
jgi:hypothetical protein